MRLEQIDSRPVKSRRKKAQKFMKFATSASATNERFMHLTKAHSQQVLDTINPVNITQEQEQRLIRLDAHP